MMYMSKGSDLRGAPALLFCRRIMGSRDFPHQIVKGPAQDEAVFYAEFRTLCRGVQTGQRQFFKRLGGPKIFLSLESSPAFYKFRRIGLMNNDGSPFRDNEQGLKAKSRGPERARR